MLPVLVFCVILATGEAVQATSNGLQPKSRVKSCYPGKVRSMGYGVGFELVLRWYPVALP